MISRGRWGCTASRQAAWLVFMLASNWVDVEDMGGRRKASGAFFIVDQAASEVVVIINSALVCDFLKF